MSDKAERTAGALIDESDADHYFNATLRGTQEITRLSAVIPDLVKALEPFAKFADAVEVPAGSDWGTLDDDDPVDGACNGAPTIGDCRAARAALLKARPTATAGE